MANKKTPSTPRPMISAAAAKIRSVTTYNGTQVATPEETQKRKRGFLDTIDMIASKFQNDIQADKVRITSVADFEKLVKLALLLSGEADSISGKAAETEVASETMRLSMSKIEEILKEDDPEVIAMYNKLYEKYNELNDIDE